MAPNSANLVRLVARSRGKMAEKRRPKAELAGAQDWQGLLSH
jgi:hypothetical protein